MPSRQAIEALPKVELHVHLEGATQPGTYLRLAKKNGVSLPATDEAGMREWFKFTDFRHFVEVYVACSKTIQTTEDLEIMGEEFAREQARQNIFYTEATYTASTIFQYAGIPGREQIEALKAGFAKVPETRVELVLDIVKELGPEVGEWTSALCQEFVGRGVIAIGIAGFEGKGTVAAHSHAIRSAMKAGLRMTAHAGETRGPEVIREVLADADAERIGHGVRCLEDPELTQELLEKQIHLEVNPSSNVCLGVFPSLEAHPIGKLVEMGMNVSLNSDDPPFFNTTLTDEYERCAKTFGWDDETLFKLARNTAANSFLPEKDRSALLAKVDAHYQKMRTC